MRQRTRIIEAICVLYWALRFWFIYWRSDAAPKGKGEGESDAGN